MIYEIISEIKNSCSNNQMRDVFFTEENISDPDAWIKAREPGAVIVEKEIMPGGLRYTLQRADIPVIYTLTEAE